MSIDLQRDMSAEYPRLAPVVTRSICRLSIRPFFLFAFVRMSAAIDRVQQVSSHLNTNMSDGEG
jgi:hypothetical protein